LLAPLGRRLSRRVPLARPASHGPRRGARPPPGPAVPRTGVRNIRRRRVPAIPHPLLARRQRRDAPGPLLGRRGARPAPHCRRGPGARAAAVVGRLSLPLRGRADIPLVPVGCAAARDGAARDLVRAHAAGAQPDHGAAATRAGALARVGTVVPPHGAVGRYEARERGSHVASPHGPRLPLLDPAAPTVARLVRAMAARVVAPGHDARDPRDRARCSLADPRAAALAISALRRLRPSGRGPARDRADGKLRVLQPAGDRAMRAAPRRRRIAARAAARAHGGRAGAALETVRGPRSRSRAGGPGRAGLRPRDRADAARRAPATRESIARRRSATPLGERIWSVPRDDHRAARDRDRRQRGYPPLERVRLPVEAGRRRPSTQVHGAAYAAARLADVVRGARPGGRASVALAPPAEHPRGHAPGLGAARGEPVSGAAAQVRAARVLPIPLRLALGARADRRVVGAGPGRVSDAAAVGCRLRRVPLTLLPTRLSSGPRAGLPVHARAVCF